ncbi:hypothetical protein ACFPOD_03875 [Nitratireductor kimnyeongensis]|uniref:Uncharacterized protein n=1 Tax=Nitratireductor kimnyeongensis TaxID=430679 RepID=A0ABW0T4X8_9HYPH|nr:hypothetical protein [Nitratireductor kimnyeongensis]QZZ34763.1 hypothetical protein KW403_13310 [Nitratireductor kimnyeongensis]
MEGIASKGGADRNALELVEEEIGYIFFVAVDFACRQGNEFCSRCGSALPRMIETSLSYQADIRFLGTPCRKFLESFWGIGRAEIVGLDQRLFSEILCVCGGRHAAWWGIFVAR